MSLEDLKTYIDTNSDYIIIACVVLALIFLKLSQRSKTLYYRSILPKAEDKIIIAIAVLEKK